MEQESRRPRLVHVLVVVGMMLVLAGDYGREVFAAIREDTLAAFVPAHPDWVISTPKR